MDARKAPKFPTMDGQSGFKLRLETFFTSVRKEVGSAGVAHLGKQNFTQETATGAREMNPSPQGMPV
jgi:hypothetical protein